jgi:hypothetical protein
MESPITNHDGLIVIEETLASKQDEVTKEVTGDEKKKHAEGDSKYRRPKWCPQGLNKSQQRKLQCARHRQ